jgi:uncharacterized membrane protein YraQ (UPF0718 family)
VNTVVDEEDRPASRLQRYATDYFLQINALIVAVLFLLGALDLVTMDTTIGRAAHAVHELFGVMWWGILIAVFVIGILDKLPQELIIALLGQPGSRNGVYRAAVAGVLLDLCSHGILMVGAKLYDRGASIGQLVAFLIASPWNSISLTFILFALIGIGWTLAFIALSLVIAVVSGLAFEALVARGTLPANRASVDLPEDYPIIQEGKKALTAIDWRPAGILDFCIDGVRGARIVLRWLLFGLVVAAAVRAFVDPGDFATWFGPTLFGLGATLIATSIFEVCSEGSVPIASELMNRALAPGNSFAFLLAGVATDYTEVMVVKETTASWKISLFIPLITVPQVLLIGAALNAVWGG